MNIKIQMIPLLPPTHLYFFVPAMQKKDIFTLQVMQFCQFI